MHKTRSFKYRNVIIETLQQSRCKWEVRNENGVMVIQVANHVTKSCFQIVSLKFQIMSEQNKNVQLMFSQTKEIKNTYKSLTHANTELYDLSLFCMIYANKMLWSKQFVVSLFLKQFCYYRRLVLTFAIYQMFREWRSIVCCLFASVVQ